MQYISQSQIAPHDLQSNKIIRHNEWIGHTQIKRLVSFLIGVTHMQ